MTIMQSERSACLVHRAETPPSRPAWLNDPELRRNFGLAELSTGVLVGAKTVEVVMQVLTELCSSGHVALFDKLIDMLDDPDISFTPQELETAKCLRRLFNGGDALSAPVADVIRAATHRLPTYVMMRDPLTGQIVLPAERRTM